MLHTESPRGLALETYTPQLISTMVQSRRQNVCSPVHLVISHRACVGGTEVPLIQFSYSVSCS